MRKIMCGLLVLTLWLGGVPIASAQSVSQDLDPMVPVDAAMTVSEENPAADLSAQQDNDKIQKSAATGAIQETEKKKETSKKKTSKSSSGKKKAQSKSKRSKKK